MKDSANTSPDISICIANYNGAGVLRKCLDSVYAQRGCAHEGDFTFEVLVHDDASTDGSMELVRREFPDVRTIESNRNVGFCISNNRMAAAALGRYLLLLNNDAELRPGSLAAFFKEARQLGHPALLGLPQFTLPDGRLLDRGYEFDFFMNPIPVLTNGMHEVATSTGACLWIPRLVWNAVGGFPPWFESVAEDIYVCQAARLLGFPTLVLNAPGFDHWVGQNLGGGKIVSGKLKTTARRRALSERNKTSVMLICYPVLALAVLLPIHTLLLAIEALFLWITGAERSHLRRIYGSILPDIWRRRRDIAATRRDLQSRKARGGLRYMIRFKMFPHKIRMLMRHGKPEIR